MALVGDLAIMVDHLHPYAHVTRLTVGQFMTAGAAAAGIATVTRAAVNVLATRTQMVAQSCKVTRAHRQIHELMTSLAIMSLHVSVEYPVTYNCTYISFSEWGHILEDEIRLVVAKRWVITGLQKVSY